MRGVVGAEWTYMFEDIEETLPDREGHSYLGHFWELWIREPAARQPSPAAPDPDASNRVVVTFTAGKDHSHNA